MAETQRICSVEGCGKKHAAQGLCDKHYRQARHSGEVALVGPRVYPRCSVEGCEEKGRVRGLCRKHYGRFMLHGDPTAGKQSPGAIQEWLRAHASYRGEDCLIWPFGKGRGDIGLDGQRMTAARAMAVLAFGPPPSTAHMACHSCRNGLNGCVSPMHLRWDTPTANQRDRIKDGTDVRGEKHHRAKLTKADVREMRRLGSTMTHQAIATHFGVTKTTAGEIIRRQSWAWLSD